jgi:type II secretory pathway pseudopilin PulG
LLAILGVIATFTIPKVLQAQQDESSNARAKEAASMIIGAMQQAQLAGVITSASKPLDLTPYMNYVSMDTAGVNSIDAHVGLGSMGCNTLSPCLRLHNGGTLGLLPYTFNGSTTTNCIQIYFDPDNTYSGSASDGPSKSVSFHIYMDGSLRTRATVKNPSCQSNTCGFGPLANSDPSWFHWN